MCAAAQLTLVDCGRPSKFTYVANLQGKGVAARAEGDAHTPARRLHKTATTPPNYPPHPRCCSLLGVGGGRQHHVGTGCAAVAMVALCEGGAEQLIKRRQTVVGARTAKHSSMLGAVQLGARVTMQNRFTMPANRAQHHPHS